MMLGMLLGMLLGMMRNKPMPGSARIGWRCGCTSQICCRISFNGSGNGSRKVGVKLSSSGCQDGCMGLIHGLLHKDLKVAERKSSMRTRWWDAVSETDRAAHLREAAELLRAGGIIAFPTETVYGLGADARSDEAVERVFRAKGRPSDNPLIVHIADRSQLDGLVADIPEPAKRLMDAFWPGPLSLVLPAVPGAVSERVTAGLRTVAVRMPAHATALAFLREAGCPVAAPSANRSGRPSPTAARHVLEDLDGRIDGIIDGGPTGIGLESTVVEITEEGAVRILRPGGVTREQILSLGLHVVRDEPAEAMLKPVPDVPEHADPERNPDFGRHADKEQPSGEAQRQGPKRLPEQGRHPDTKQDSVRERQTELETPELEAPELEMPELETETPDRPMQPLREDWPPGAPPPRSPGMKYAHYAPLGTLEVYVGDSPERVLAHMRRQLAEAGARGDRTAALVFSEHAEAVTADAVFDLGSKNDPRQAARRLYDALRECDARGIRFIVAEGVTETEIGEALMNRLRKAASGRVYTI